MATERFFCDSCGDQILDEADVLRLFGNDYCDVCYHEQDHEVSEDDQARWDAEDYRDCETPYGMDLDCGFDPYMGSYSDDC